MRRRPATVERPYVWPNDQFGPWRRPTIDEARLRVRQAALAADADAEVRERLAQNIAATGNCVWHAIFEVFETPLCHCTPCTRLRQDAAKDSPCRSS